MALIGKHNINNSVFSDKFVYVSGYKNGDVWIFLSARDAMTRFRHHEIDNDRLPNYCSDINNIGIWITPCRNGLYDYYVRGATGDIMKDFDSLIKSRSHTPFVKEIIINAHINSNETVKQFYERNNYFEDHIKDIIKH